MVVLYRTGRISPNVSSCRANCPSMTSIQNTLLRTLIEGARAKHHLQMQPDIELRSEFFSLCEPCQCPETEKLLSLLTLSLAKASPTSEVRMAPPSQTLFKQGGLSMQSV